MKMLTSWLPVAALLAASGSPAAADRGPLTVADTCRVRGHPEATLTLNCGHGENAGVVRYWHTPFGELRAPGPHRDLAPVFMRHDGSLVIPRSSSLHGGLYYCLLQHAAGSTLWPYELHAGVHRQENTEDDGSCRTLRVRRNAASAGEGGAAGVSDAAFAGAVAASVLLTFVLGFSAGALTRAQVLRCVHAITAKVRSLRQPHRPGRHPEVSMTTLPSEYDNEAFAAGRVWDGVTMETTAASPRPPVKPQRSFRLNREEQQETAEYLEGCDATKEEKRGREEEREVAGSHPSGDDAGSQSETAGEKNSGDGEEEHRRREEERDETEGDGGQTDEDAPEQSETEEDTDTQGIMGGREAPSPPPRPARRSRIIRLYQYDEDGQRYCHLPDPAPEESVPAPKQRSLSLTRLNAIMAAASAGPLDGQETRGEAREEVHFHMEI